MGDRSSGVQQGGRTLRRTVSSVADFYNTNKTNLYNSTERSQWCPLGDHSGCCSVLRLLRREIYSEELSEKEPANTPLRARVGTGNVYTTPELETNRREFEA